MKEYKYIVLLFALVFLGSGCQKDEIGVSSTTVIDSGSTQTTESTVVGLITDETGTPLGGVTVQHRGDFIESDENGYFKFENAQASDEGGLLKFTEEGFFKNYKWYFPILNDQAFVRVVMVKERTVGTIDVALGGSVTLNGGATVSFPADAFEGANGSSVEVLAHCCLLYTSPSPRDS